MPLSLILRRSDFISLLFTEGIFMNSFTGDSETIIKYSSVQRILLINDFIVTYWMNYLLINSFKKLCWTMRACVYMIKINLLP